jgi:ACS family tartrate transporter-like MFS transporter
MNLPPLAPPADVTVGARACRRLRRRLLPYLILLYVVAFLDRVNVNFAALHMTRDLGFGPRDFGLGMGIFFLGYFLFEIPGTIIVERSGARRWIARIMVTWGLVAILMATIHTPRAFYVLRFLLGLAEAGFFPGIIVYLTHWFPTSERAKALGLFTAAIPVSNMLGAPISGLILGVHWAGLAGWRWLFLIEGAPAVVLGVVTFFFLTDRPSQARWLPADEKAWLIARLAEEARARETKAPHRFGRAMRDPRVWLLALAFFLIVVPSYGFQLWIPQMVAKASHLSPFGVALVVDVAYLLGLPSLLLVGWSSDRSGERRWHSVAPMLLFATGLFATAGLEHHWPAVVLALVVAGAGLNAHLPAFWALPPQFLTGEAAAGSVGLINSIGNLGGFLGPTLVGALKEGRPDYGLGLAALGGFALLAAATIAVAGALAKATPAAARSPAPLSTDSR